MSIEAIVDLYNNFVNTQYIPAVKGILGPIYEAQANAVGGFLLSIGRVHEAQQWHDYIASTGLVDSYTR